MGRERRNTSPWVLTGNDKSHQGWLMEEYIYTNILIYLYLTSKIQSLLGAQVTRRAGAKPSDRPKGNSRFVRAVQLKPAKRQMALLPLTGSWQLFLGAPWGPGPGKKMKHKGEEKQQAIWPWMHVNTCSWNQSFKWKNRKDPFILSFALSVQPYNVLQCCNFSGGQKKWADTTGGALCYLTGANTCSLMYLGQQTSSC